MDAATFEKPSVIEDDVRKRVVELLRFGYVRSETLDISENDSFSKYGMDWFDVMSFLIDVEDELGIKIEKSEMRFIAENGTFGFAMETFLRKMM